MKESYNQCKHTPIYRFLIDPIREYICIHVRSYLRLPFLKQINELISSDYPYRRLTLEHQKVATKSFLDFFIDDDYANDTSFMYASVWVPYRDKFYKDMIKIYDNFVYDQQFIVLDD
jgi:hypothetical protein